MKTGDRLPWKLSTTCRSIYKHRACGIKVIGKIIRANQGFELDLQVIDDFKCQIHIIFATENNHGNDSR